MLTKYSFGSGLRSVMAVALSVCLLTAATWAGEGYIAHNQLDSTALLAPPPLPNSPEQAADLATAQMVYKNRTPEERDRAEKDASLSIYNFTPAIGEFFQKGKFPKVDFLFQNVKTNLSEIIDQPKNVWKRQRPYQVDPTMTVSHPENSYSYPSGHSTRGTVQALIFAELFPEKREAILEMGCTIGWDRVLLAKHFPTDIYAGRVLGKNIFRELLKSPEFQKDLAAAKAEVQAAQK